MMSTMLKKAGAALVAASVLASAMPAAADSHVRGDELFQTIGDRHRDRHGDWRHRHGHRQHHRRDRDHDDDVAAGIILGILGLAAGAAILGAASEAEERSRQVDLDHRRSDWIARCSARYRTFDPRSGTYRGHDGRLHACR